MYGIFSYKLIHISLYQIVSTKIILTKEASKEEVKNVVDLDARNNSILIDNDLN